MRRLHCDQCDAVISASQKDPLGSFADFRLSSAVRLIERDDEWIFCGRECVADWLLARKKATAEYLHARLLEREERCREKERELEQRSKKK